MRDVAEVDSKQELGQRIDGVAGDDEHGLLPPRAEHTLRRTFGSDLVNRGLRLDVVSRLLGHASTTVTERCYAELLDSTTRREFLAVVRRDWQVSNRMAEASNAGAMAPVQRLTEAHKTPPFFGVAMTAADRQVHVRLRRTGEGRDVACRATRGTTIYSWSWRSRWTCDIGALEISWGGVLEGFS